MRRFDPGQSQTSLRRGQLPVKPRAFGLICIKIAPPQRPAAQPMAG